MSADPSCLKPHIGRTRCLKCPWSRSSPLLRYFEERRIARVIPCQANAYVASIGYMLYGLPGAVLTTLAIQLPGYVMLPLQRGYEHLRSAGAMRGFTRGLTSASVGLILAATVSIGQATLTELVPWLVFLLALGLPYRLKWHPLFIGGIASVAGIVLRTWL